VKKISRCIALVVASALAALPLRAAETVKAVRARSAPVVDGRLKETVWGDAQPVTDFTIMDTDRPAEFATRAMVLYDDDSLYIGMVCAEPEVDDLVVQEVPFDNGNVFRGDCIEIMLDPERDGSDYYHFGVNVSGSRFDRRVSQGGHVGDERWNGAWRAATHVGEDFWSCEVAIPFFCLGITPEVGSTWAINLCREKKKPFAENSSIAERGAFNVAGAFATLSGLNVDFRRFCYDVGAPRAQTRVEGGRLQLTLTMPVTNRTGRRREIILEALLCHPEKRPYIKSVPLHLDADMPVTCTFEPFTLEKQGNYECFLRVADAAQKKTLAQTHSILEVSYVPIAVRWIEPWYRDCIFETQDLKQAVAEIEIRLPAERLDGLSLRAVLRTEKSDEPIASVAVQRPTERNIVRFEIEPLPYGKLLLAARIEDAAGKVVEETRHPLRKLPRKAGEVWLGPDRVWRVDGKPFFLNGAWGYLEDMNPYYNAHTGYSSETVRRIAYIYIPEAMRKEFQRERLSEPVQRYIREKTVEAARDPRLFAHYLWDEPEVGGVTAKALKMAYDIMRDADPYHPVIISNDSLSGLKEYADCAEINGYHPYPPVFKDKPVNDFGKLVDHLEKWDELWRSGLTRQTIAFLHQGFNYGDYGAVNQRVPNYVELRDQNILALILGATGVIQFNRCVQQYPELRIGIPHLTRELAYLGRAIVAPTSDIGVALSRPKARALLKELDGEMFLFVSNACMEAGELTVTVPGLSERAGELRVVSEGRSVRVRRDRFTDRFDTFEAHVYTTSPEQPDLLTVREICALIAEANRARRKPGNLVFQEYEGEGVVLRASSNAAGQYRRPDNGLWHVVDGVISEVDRYKCLTWQDATPNEFPDWLEIRMPAAHKVGRVVVYPFEKSLRDYAVQLFVDGDWRDVARATGCEADRMEHVFAPLVTDRVRLWVAATNGPHAMVTEIEVYER